MQIERGGREWSWFGKAGRRARRARWQAPLALGTAVFGVAAFDLLTGGRLTGRGKRGLSSLNPFERRPIRVQRSITINRTPDEIWKMWRGFENLPRFMTHLESVTWIDERRSRWVAHGPAGTNVEWVAELVDDQPGRRIAWRSVPEPGASSSNRPTVETRGEVRFVPTPGDRGTEVHVSLEYQAPAGALGVAVARLFGEEPGQQIKGDLYRFKQVMEVGEVMKSDASIHRGPHPGQPS